MHAVECKTDKTMQRRTMRYDETKTTKLRRAGWCTLIRSIAERKLARIADCSGAYLSLSLTHSLFPSLLHQACSRASDELRPSRSRIFIARHVYWRVNKRARVGWTISRCTENTLRTPVESETDHAARQWQRQNGTRSGAAPLRAASWSFPPPRARVGPQSANAIGCRGPREHLVSSLSASTRPLLPIFRVYSLIHQTHSHGHTIGK